MNDTQALQEQIQALQEKIRTLENGMAFSSNDKRLFYVEKMKEIYTSAPAYIPKTFPEQFVFYKNGVTKRLYVYVDGDWTYTALT
ncbi:MAG: hypothetical protein WC788_08045 [Candidatus Paceibacterota bacterium]|jgi:hypothetical protein